MEFDLLFDEYITLAAAAEKKAKTISWVEPENRIETIIGWIDDTWSYTYHLINDRIL
ncbi:hypothetical protein GCM10028805_33100 [Spirosoma harenae]